MPKPNVLPYDSSEPEGPQQGPGVLRVMVFSLSGATAAVAFHGAAQEPFTTFVLHDALLHVGAGSLLLGLWLAVLIIAALRAFAGRYRWGLLVLAPWGAVNCLFLWHNLTAYLDDIRRFT